MTFMAKQLIMNKNKQLSVFLVAFLVAVLIPACGSKGDLYQGEQDKAQANKIENEQQVQSPPQNKGQ